MEGASLMRGRRTGVRVGLRSRLEGQLLSPLGWGHSASEPQFSCYIRGSNRRALTVTLRHSWEDSAQSPPHHAGLTCALNANFSTLVSPHQRQLVLLQLQLINCFSNYWVHDSYVPDPGLAQGINR